MRYPFLFTLSLCALPQATKAQPMQMTDLLPMEKGIQVMQLPNGIKTYIQEHDIPPQCGSFRVIMRRPLSENELYCFDCTIESLEGVEQFFNHCQEMAAADLVEEAKAFEDIHFRSSDLPSIDKFSPQEMAVIAVGDFQAREMQNLIKKHFNHLSLSSETIDPEERSIQIGVNAGINQAALSLAYPIKRRSVQTYEDLNEVWKVLLLQDLFQHRLERCTRGINEIWVHPHSRFFFPVSGYSLVPPEDCENLLTFFLWQEEAIRSDGFFEDEFYITKRNLLNQLQYLASRAALPDDAFLASYFADQFLLTDHCSAHQSFMDASAEFIEKMELQDLIPYIDSFLLEENRAIQVAYPTPDQSQFLTKEQIEQMVERISTFASFFRDSEILEDEDDYDFWSLEAKRSSPFIQLANSTEAEPLRLADNIVVRPINNVLGGTEPFYQLSITEKDKKIISDIITTIAEKNILQLAFIKHSVERKGKKIERVHPMRFMGYILSSSELRSCLKTIKKSSFKWDHFIAGFSRRMKEEYAHDNVYIYVPGFCQQINGDEEAVKRFIKRKDWEGIVKEYM
jgi:hypothetical protein